jgi:DNA-binding response OmpR family regulator
MQFIRRRPFDIVLLDRVLPDGHAERLLNDILEHNPETTIMGLSTKNAMVDDPRVAVCLNRK